MQGPNTVVILVIFVSFLRGAVSKASREPCCTGQHEKYTECGPACGGDGCTPIQYVRPCNQSCVAGCFCECGYFRNSEGECVSPDQCPRGTASNIDYPKLCPGRKCCGKYEFFTQSNACFDSCPPSGPDDPIIDCFFELEPGCFCLPGYKRNFRTKKCVPSNQCPSEQVTPVCHGANEQYTTCGSACQTCHQVVADALGKPVRCTLQCLIGCHCADGYYRDNKGNCVTARKCLAQAGITPTTAKPEPKCKKPHEIYNTCGSHCQTCPYAIANVQGNPLPVCPPVCVVGCFCESGYWRDGNGDCVTTEECLEQTTPGSCPVNETRRGCGACESCEEGIEMITSKNYACPYDCWGPQYCKCLKGYFRNDQNDCVLLKDCPSFPLVPSTTTPSSVTCDDPNETQSGCYSGCDSCIHVVAEALGDPLQCFLPCVEGICHCKDGFYRNSAGQCITKVECLEEVGINGTTTPFPVIPEPTTASIATSTIPSPVCEGPHETNEGCYTGCDSCEYIVSQTSGKPIRCRHYCVEGICHCEEGYFRNSTGQCISKASCLGETGRRTTTSSPIITTTPSIACNGPHETFEGCYRGCDTCKFIVGQTLGEPLQCLHRCIEDVCHCEEGFYRNSTGICVSEQDCLEEEGLLTTTSSPEVVTCPSVPEEPTRCKGANEVYSECRTACDNCQHGILEHLGKPLFCTQQCIVGCSCRKGFYRDHMGNCVELKKCLEQAGITEPKPDKCNGPHEHYTDCGSGCSSCFHVVSEAQGNPMACPAVCLQGCFCESGYWRDGSGNCVTGNQCLEQAGLPTTTPKPIEPQCNKPNQEYTTCGSSCKSCSHVVDAAQGNPSGCAAVCLEGCFCTIGYYMDRNGDCLTADQCLAQVNITNPTCEKPFEEYTDCGFGCQTCSYMISESSGIPQGCLAVCVPGCHCQPGYWRDRTGNCISASQCFIQEGSCNRPFEEYNSCGSACQTCSFHLSQSTNNPSHCVTVCEPGCHCQSGYWRDDSTGLCVPEAKCHETSPPKPIDRRCNRPNQEFTKCGSSCQTCTAVVSKALGNPVICTDHCIVGCQCREGFYKDKFGNCVTEKQCLDLAGLSGPPKPDWCQRTNELYTTCGSSCDTCAHVVADARGTPAVCTLECLTGCHCAPGFFRDANKNCVSKEQCLEDAGITPEPPVPCGPRSNPKDCPKCPPNEGHEGCGNCESCFVGVEKSQGREVFCLQFCKEPKECKCKVGFWRNDAGNCVTLEKCLKEHPVIDTHSETGSCPVNEGHEGCGNCEACVDGLELSLGIPPVCPKYCKPADKCKCQKGFWRNSAGACVGLDECVKDANKTGMLIENSFVVDDLPPVICDGDFEEPGCQPCQSCVALRQPMPCFFQCPDAPENICKCLDGYYRDDSGECVPEAQCYRKKKFPTNPY